MSSNQKTAINENIENYEIRRHKLLPTDSQNSTYTSETSITFKLPEFEALSLASLSLEGTKNVLTAASYLSPVQGDIRRIMITDNNGNVINNFDEYGLVYINQMINTEDRQTYLNNINSCHYPNIVSQADSFRIYEPPSNIQYGLPEFKRIHVPPELYVLTGTEVVSMLTAAGDGNAELIKTNALHDAFLDSVVVKILGISGYIVTAPVVPDATWNGTAASPAIITDVDLNTELIATLNLFITELNTHGGYTLAIPAINVAVDVEYVFVASTPDSATLEEVAVWLCLVYNSLLANYIDHLTNWFLNTDLYGITGVQNALQPIIGSMTERLSNIFGVKLTVFATTAISGYYSAWDTALTSTTAADISTFILTAINYNIAELRTHFCLTETELPDANPTTVITSDNVVGINAKAYKMFNEILLHLQSYIGHYSTQLIYKPQYVVANGSKKFKIRKWMGFLDNNLVFFNPSLFGGINITFFLNNNCVLSNSNATFSWTNVCMKINGYKNAEIYNLATQEQTLCYDNFKISKYVHSATDNTPIVHNITKTRHLNNIHISARATTYKTQGCNYFNALGNNFYRFEKRYLDKFKFRETFLKDYPLNGFEDIDYANFIENTDSQCLSIANINQYETQQFTYPMSFRLPTKQYNDGEDSNGLNFDTQFEFEYKPGTTESSELLFITETRECINVQNRQSIRVI